jgi:hypothetical protein
MEKTITITGAKGAMALLDDVVALIESPKPMQGVVNDIKAVILEKTAAGRDYANSSFNPYSESYAKAKGSRRVNLRDSGTMLDSIKAEVVDPHHGRIFVESTSEPGGKINADMLAQIHNTGTGKQPQREFMNVNKTQLAAAVKKHYDDPILEIVKRSSNRG